MFGVHRNRIDSKINKAEQKHILLQLFWTVLLNGYAAGFAKKKIFTGSTKALCVPVLNCYSCPGALGSCPVGSLQTMLNHHRFPFYVLGTLMLFGVAVGRLVCGFMCPFGFVQDLLHKIPIRKIRVPKKLDKILRYMKYVIFVVAVILLPIAGLGKTTVIPPYFCKYICPAGMLEGGIPHVIMNAQLRGLIGFLFNWKLLLLVIVVILSTMIHRPFCKYVCPLGAFYGVCNKFSFYQMNLDKAKCVGCKKCEKVCPMNVEVTKNINSVECIRCGRCKSVCPTNAITNG